MRFDATAEGTCNGYSSDDVGHFTPYFLAIFLVVAAC
jgi:hypothetical protein